ncbi:putative membrane protein required for colicin V production [Heliophilum fasciatum]|nr:CvpA family protein [Heliophilum fasciatum]MCW2278242.1 putative membrane protein required for colicin V production [Heliophilum fasciatum]
MNALDGVILAALGLAFYYGYRRGFLTLVIGAGAYGLGFFVATGFYKVVAAGLDGWIGAVPWLRGYLVQRLALPMATAKVQPEMVAGLNLERIFHEGMLQGIALPLFFRQEMAKQLSTWTGAALASMTNLGEMVADYVAHSLWHVLVFGLLWLFVALSAKVAARLWMRWRGDGFLGMADRTLGALLIGGSAGVALMLLVTWFYGSPGTSPLRLESEPLRVGSLLFPYLMDMRQELVAWFGGFTFR